MTAQRGNFSLTNVHNGDTCLFQYFPTGINLESRVNWSAQDTTIGVKPLSYSNAEPLRVTIDELLIDRSVTNESIEQDIKRLLRFQKETKEGRPPTLYVVWGNWQEVVVLEEVNIKQTFFTSDGDPIRAYLSITLLEMQDVGTNTSEPVIRDDDVNP
jgi:hypothetical protein